MPRALVVLCLQLLSSHTTLTSPVVCLVLVLSCFALISYRIPQCYTVQLDQEGRKGCPMLELRNCCSMFAPVPRRVPPYRSIPPDQRRDGCPMVEVQC